VTGLSALFLCSLSARRDTFHTAPPRAHRALLSSVRPDVRAAEERRRHALQLNQGGYQVGGTEGWGSG